MKNLFANRRRFLHRASLGAAASLAIPQIVAEAYAAQKPARITLAKNDVILFQGDSITDASRRRDEAGHNTTGVLGNGYALLAASELLLRHADKQLKIYNKGISGNKVFQLAERWDTDCLALKPTVVSLLIGVNDFWHTLTEGYKGTAETYRNDLQALLERTKKELPKAKLIVGEPFAVKGTQAVDSRWDLTFDAYREAARDAAARFGAVFIPYQAVFDKAGQAAPGTYWAPDGVHPSVAGAELMARAWLETVK